MFPPIPDMCHNAAVQVEGHRSLQICSVRNICSQTLENMFSSCAYRPHLQGYLSQSYSFSHPFNYNAYKHSPLCSGPQRRKHICLIKRKKGQI